jgi:hypothetical protein
MQAKISGVAAKQEKRPGKRSCGRSDICGAVRIIRVVAKKQSLFVRSREVSWQSDVM